MSAWRPAYWLGSLESPPSDKPMTAVEAMKFPAVELFMERAAASGSSLELRDAEIESAGLPLPQLGLALAASIELLCGTALRSPNRHASKHAHASGHPVIASAEEGERWLYCYPDERVMEY